MKENLIKKIKSRINDLPKKKHKIALYLLEHLDDVSFMNINSISEKTGVSTATIIRFARDFDFNGFLDFKTQLQKEIKRKLNPSEIVFPSDKIIDENLSIFQIAEQETNNINKLLHNLDIDIMNNLVNNIYKSKRVYTFGAGISKIFSKMLTYLFNQIGKESYCLDEGIISPQRKLLNLKKNDIILFSSFPPYSLITIELANIAYNQGLKTVAFTDNKHSPITKYSKIVFPIPTDNLLFTNSIAAFSIVANSLSTELVLKNKDKIVKTLKKRNKILKDFYY